MIVGWISEALSDIDEAEEFEETTMNVPLIMAECAIAFPPYAFHPTKGMYAKLCEVSDIR